MYIFKKKDDGGVIEAFFFFLYGYSVTLFNCEELGCGIVKFKLYKII